MPCGIKSRVNESKNRLGDAKRSAIGITNSVSRAKSTLFYRNSRLKDTECRVYVAQSAQYLNIIQQLRFEDVLKVAEYSDDGKQFIVFDSTIRL